MLALIAGCILCIVESKYRFALSNYKVEAQSKVLEQRLWEVFPKRCLTFWPYFLSDKEAMRDFLERHMPVKVETKMSGLGNFTTIIKWLQAWVKVDWRGKIWCISRDGFMWLSEPGRPNEDEAGRLVWKVPDQGNLPDDENVNAPMFGVFRSPLSTEVIASFLDDFRQYRWFDLVNEVVWERREGMNLFRLQLMNGTQRIELLVQPDKYPGQSIGASIQEVFERAVQEGGNRVIDATYENKIVLRKL